MDALRPLTSLEAIACTYASAPEGRLYTYRVIAGARRLQAQQRQGDVSVRAYKAPVAADG